MRQTRWEWTTANERRILRRSRRLARREFGWLDVPEPEPEPDEQPREITIAGPGEWGPPQTTGHTGAISW
jgi:hypothetical protein